MKLISSRGGEAGLAGREGEGFELACAPELGQHFPNAYERLLADLTHFIPMQDPGLAAEAILEGSLRP